jgi:hypothetical protein
MAKLRNQIEHKAHQHHDPDIGKGPRGDVAHLVPVMPLEHKEA